eukprot:gene15133-17333_t
MVASTEVFLLVVVLIVHLQACYSLRVSTRPSLFVKRAPKVRKIETFQDFPKIPTWLKGNLKKLGFITPTDVQKRALPTIFAGKDVVVQAHTGSGKTLVYSLPILSCVDASHSAIQAVIVVPTRELGLQVAQVLKELAAGAPKKIGIMSVVEGSKNRRQMLWATADPPHIVVGNPKALQRLVDLGRLRLNAVDMVVLDEVDACIIEPTTKKELHKLLSRNLSKTFLSLEEALLDEDPTDIIYKDHVKDHLDSMGLGENTKYHLERQTIMCSATIPQRQHFAASCFKNGWTATVPELINVSEDQLVPPQVVHMHIPCSAELRLPCLAAVLKSELRNGTTNVISAGKIDVSDYDDDKADCIVYTKQAIVFVDEREAHLIDTYAYGAIKTLEKMSTAGAHEIEDSKSTSSNTKSVHKRKAIEQQSRVGVLLESMSLEARARVLDNFRYGDSQVLVCTDMAARGLDIPSTTLVIQMSLPNRIENYIHRAGRTGRLNREGKVISFTHPEEDFVVQRFSNELGRLKTTTIATRPYVELQKFLFKLSIRPVTQFRTINNQLPDLQI